MAVSTLNTEVDYVGDGTVTEFQITFQFITTKAEDQIRVYLVTTDDDGFEVETLQTLGLDYEFVYANPPPDDIDPTAIDFLLVAPTALQTVRIRRELTIEQVYEYLNTGRFMAKKHEEALDSIVMMLQQVDRIAQEALTIAGGAEIPPFEAGFLLAANEDGDGFVWLDPAELGITGVIGLPTDGAYGDPVLGDPTGLLETDLAADAFDKVVSLLALIAPAPPGLLSSKTLLITGGYTALEATTGDSHYATSDTTPEISPGLAQTLANSFRDANSGTLSAQMDAVEIGSRVLSAADDSGTYGELQILFDFDPYLGQAGKEGIFKGLIAKINSASLAVGEHTAALIHTLTGTASRIFYVDDPVTPSVTSAAISTSGSVTYKSGVPGIAAGQIISVTGDVNNAVKTHYNATRIAAASGSQITTTNQALPGSPPAPDAVVAVAISAPVASSAYSENISVTITGYNSAGGTASANATNNIRVDTVGAETRLLSGTGTFPASGYGGAFNSQTDVLTGNRELQYLNGRYQYPPAVNYSGLTPAGPNYSALASDTNSMRWYTISLGTVTAVTSVTFTINGAVNFGATALVSGIELTIRVDGGTPTTGWVDGNVAYPGVGNPTANGDAALVVGSSTATSKLVTFGAAVKTGTVYVRIGIPSGSNKTFTGIS